MTTGSEMGYKMVRDKHRDVLSGVISGEWRTSPDPIGALTAKIGEEYGEFAKDHDPAELYDLMDVIRELAYLTDPLHEAREAHRDKVDRLGRFALHLEWHPLPDAADHDDPDFAGQ